MIRDANRLLLNQGKLGHCRLSAGTLGNWPGALCCFASALWWRRQGSLLDRQACVDYFARLLGSEGRWLQPADQVGGVMKAYPLLLLLEEDTVYQWAVDSMANFLLSDYPKGPDGCLPYHPQGGIMLVDTLPMVCPFLVRYARVRQVPEAATLALHQLTTFTRVSVDVQTGLPFHGYDPEGVDRLGLQGWGRGTGWYMFGLVDSLGELSSVDRPQILVDAFLSCAAALRRFQREDGHWSEIIPNRYDYADSSATALLSYALQRGQELGLLEAGYADVLVKARTALARSTGDTGLIRQSSGECAGVGRYSHKSESHSWTQAAAAMLAAIAKRGQDT